MSVPRSNGSIGTPRHGDWREDEVVNEVRARSRNEERGRINDASALLRDRGEYACECGHGSCTTLIYLTHAEYEEVRERATYFAIAADHENPEYEAVIAHNDRYAVVEKLLEMPRRIARDTDPRT
jgi:hypothetical protein